ncbi:hypothetical protein RB213_008698, partial [Colletotrichum asianum]
LNTCRNTIISPGLSNRLTPSGYPAREVPSSNPNQTSLVPTRGDSTESLLLQPHKLVPFPARSQNVIVLQEVNSGSHPRINNRPGASLSAQ